MKYAVIGYGKMGKAVDAVAAQRGHQRTAVIESSRTKLSAPALAGARVAFEFTAPDRAEDNVVALLAAGVAVVCGTTGWDAGSAAVARALRSGGGSLMVAPNFSVGMGMFARIVEFAAARLSAAHGYDPYILEMHHRAKADAPSGTALRLAEAVRRGDGHVDSVFSGALKGRLPRGALHVVGVRGGHEEGTHTIGFDGEHDLMQLTHRARGRTGMALGAVMAGEWLAGKKGRHSFDDLLDELLVKRGNRGRGDRASMQSGRERSR